MKQVIFGAFVLAVLATGPALAQKPARLVPASAAAASRPVMICADDDATRRAFADAYGQVRFVTAEDIRAAASAGVGWSTPRCITEAELNRYREAQRKGSAAR